MVSQATLEVEMRVQQHRQPGRKGTVKAIFYTLVRVDWDDGLTSLYTQEEAARELEVLEPPA